MNRSDNGRTCRWCASPLQGRQERYCHKRCRQSAWRLRRRRSLDDTSGPGLPAGQRFAYADPPYPGMAQMYPEKEEVDHVELIASLTAASYAGWALSTSSRALRDVLPLCPAGARVCAWVKPIGVSSQTYGLHSTWEPVIIVGGRKCRPGLPDWIRAMPARGGGDLIGRKPIAFCAFLFDALGMIPGDHLEDLFPGSGIIGRAWAELSSRSPRDASLVDGRRQTLLSLVATSDG